MRPSPLHRRPAAVMVALIVVLCSIVGGWSGVGAPPAAAAPGPAACPSGGFAPGWTKGWAVAGQRRAVYALHPPGGAAGAPLFVAFNGTGEDGARFASRARLEDFAARGFLVLAPSSNGNGSLWPVWDGLRAPGQEGAPNADLALFDALVACAVSAHAVDPARIYAGGHSAGGIFTNHLAQRRSDVLAGVIVASGIYSQTSPAPRPPLDSMTVLVTWGGDNDRWSGRAGAAAVSDMRFADEAAVAGRGYAADGGHTLWSCGGAGLGHAWLGALNGWMIDALLARPKGAPAVVLAPPPAGLRAQCTAGAVAAAAPVGLRCGPSPVAGCTAACQQIADGAVSNRTVGPVLRRELRALGLSPDDCSGCLEACGRLGGGPEAQAALACLAAQPQVDPAVPGIAGAEPLIAAINTCCAGAPDPWCGAVCGELRGNLAARGYFSGCAVR
ncbi:MAG: hypothetical protein JNM72_20800 [Deltaproteobacteria bacterium]|nr:hypothetical protein [Deltaproteobacteria bacterium]